MERLEVRDFHAGNRASAASLRRDAGQEHPSDLRPVNPFNDFDGPRSKGGRVSPVSSVAEPHTERVEDEPGRFAKAKHGGG